MVIDGGIEAFRWDEQLRLNKNKETINECLDHWIGYQAHEPTNLFEQGKNFLPAPALVPQSGPLVVIVFRSANH